MNKSPRVSKSVTGQIRALGNAIQDGETKGGLKKTNPDETTWLNTIGRMKQRKGKEKSTKETYLR